MPARALPSTEPAPPGRELPAPSSPPSLRNISDACGAKFHGLDCEPSGLFFESQSLSFSLGGLAVNALSNSPCNLPASLVSSSCSAVESPSAIASGGAATASSLEYFGFVSVASSCVIDCCNFRKPRYN